MTEGMARIDEVQSVGDLLTQDQAAARLGVSVKTLANWRWQCKGPDWGKVGRTVYYDPESVSCYLRSRLGRL